MKNTILLTVALLAVLSSHAQLNFGLKAGLNRSNVKADSPDNSKASLGFNAGGFAQLSVNEKFFVQPELLYSVKGRTSPATQNSSKSTLSLNYINVPLLLGYRPSGKLAVIAGPELGYLLKATSRFDGRKNDVSNIYRDFDAGVDLGIAYRINKNIGFDLRFNYGFKGLVNVVYTDQTGNIIGEDKVGANRVLQVGLYYIF